MLVGVCVVVFDYKSTMLYEEMYFNVEIRMLDIVLFLFFVDS